MVAGIVVTHGKLGEELLETARTVYGDFDNFYALSNASKSPQVLAEELQSIISADHKASWIIFVDFVGSSCTHACLGLAADKHRTQVISGVNLPMILAFLNKRTEVPFAHLAAAIVERSFSSIKVLDQDSI